MKSARLLLLVFSIPLLTIAFGVSGPQTAAGATFDRTIPERAADLAAAGQQIFRFDTFGDEAFWTGQLRINETLSQLSPRAALGLGLKVDAGALPADLVEALRRGRVDLDDPAVTLQLLQLNAVVGVVGTVSGSRVESVGLTCAFCHSTVNNEFAVASNLRSLPIGIGTRLDGYANRDLNVGAIIAAAPTVAPIAQLLGVSEETVRQVLMSWGPGKFDAELFLDGKAFNPEQITDGVVTGRNVPGAVLIPNAFALGGHNAITWTGLWGTVTYWNAFVANLLMHGVGTFYDPRLDDAAKFPIAAANGLGHIQADPARDLITPKLPLLHLYQLNLPAPTPRAGVDFDEAAAGRGATLFNGRAGCNNCHINPIWTEPGYNLHPAADIGIDSFQADRAPNNAYRTMNLAGIFVRERGLFMLPQNKGRYYHDGRFATLMDVVNHYDQHFGLGLTPQEKSDLVEYMKSLGDTIENETPVDGFIPTAAAPEGIRAPATSGPNPSGPVATIRFETSATQPVSLKVYDLNGRLVDTLADGVREAGRYEINWDGRSAPNGVYLYKLRIGEAEQTGRIVLVK